MSSPPPTGDPNPRLVPIDFDPFAESPPTLSVPLSEAQRELWTAVRMGPESSSVHNYSYAVRLSGAVSVEGLRRAVQALFDRHDALRMVFEEEGTGQIATAPRTADVPVDDFSSLTRPEQEARLAEILAREVSTPFDLVAGPPARARIVVEAEDRCALVLTAHHIVCDGRSFQLLIDEAVRLHAASLRDGAPPLPPARSFADFLRAEAGERARAESTRAIEYWRGRFAADVPVLELPTDHPRPPVRTFAGGRRSRRLDPGLAARLRRPAARGTTMVGLLLAGFYALLHRLTGQSSIVVGLPISMWDEADPLVGHTTNFVPVRLDLEPERPLEAHLQDVRRALLEAHENRAVTFGTLVRELNPPREPGRIPLVSVVFNVDRGRTPASLPGTAAEVEAAPRRHVGFELEADVVDLGDSLDLEFSYNRDLFSAETVDSWLAAYEVLLGGMVAPAGAASSIAELPIVDEETRRRVLVEWSGAGRPEEDEPAPLVHRAFEQQAERRPRQAAVVWRGGVLTYGELDARANGLARRLRERGAGAEERVAVMLPRGPELIVALLGVLKAGAAYVPLEPSYPPARIATIVEDAAVRTIVSAPGLCPPTVGRASVLHVDDGATADSGPAPGPGPEASGGDLAYVIYTSGSTGAPKGVMIEHRSLAGYVEDTARLFDLRPEDRVLQFASISFDTAAEEIYPTLARGATIVLRTEAMATSIEELVARCREWGVTILDLPTAFWHELASALAAGTVSLPPQVRLVAIGGERALPERLEQWCRAATAGVRLLNGYGPTEATVVATWCDLVRDGRPVPGAPIGYPSAGSRTYVLDARGSPVLPGVTGELYIGGRGLARGYLGRPDLTEERFVPDPFGGSPGARLYRSGDLVRHLPDGSLAFVGRVGHQVKVRGFRIELEEIESALRRHPGVRDAVVTAPASASGVRSLVAYVVPATDAEPSPPELRRFLSETLPDYMVPPTFLTLASLPLTTSGKIDRRALPAPEATSPERLRVLPRTPVEEILDGVWREVLGLEAISIHDDFFELGGDSIRSLQVITRAAAAGIRLAAEQLFRHRTIATLAAAAEGGAASGSEPIARRGFLPRRELSAAERRLWFFDQVEPGSAAYNLGFRLRLTGSLDRSALERTIQALVDRHETLRTFFRTESGSPFAAVVPHLEVEVPLVDLRGEPADGREARADRLVADDLDRPFDLASGPLVRALLVRVDDHLHVLGLAFHHIVSDGWSLDVITRELLAAYEALAAGKTPALRPLPIHYTDFACWEADWLQGDEAERQRAFWRERLADPLPVVELPADRPRPEAQTYRGGVSRRRLSPALDSRLAALSRGQGVTPFMVHLAAFGLLLHRLTGLEDVPVGVPVAGRGREELEDLVGMFINTVVVRHDLSGDPTFVELLRRTRALALDAYRHSQLPFDRVVEDLHPQRTASRSPLFQVLVNSVDFSRGRRFELPGLVAELGGSAGTSSKFDATLYIGSEEGATELIVAYNRDLFDESRMAELLLAYDRLLEQVTAAPDGRLSDVSLVTDAARAVLPDPRLPLSPASGPTAPASFVSRARTDPERVAVAGPSGTLSYAEAERRSRWLSRRLGELGVARGDVVAILARRDVELVWAMLGVLRAGAAFAILDAAHPPGRLEACVRAARPKALLHGPGLGLPPSEAVAAVPALSLSCPDDPAAWRDETPGAGETTAPAADDLAYVAFTSGTTGGVKGVVGTHGPLSHFLRWHVETFGLKPADRFSMLSGLGHDPLLRDVFTPLCVGASLFVPAPDVLTSPAALRSFLARAEITVTHLTPSHVNLLAEGAAPGELPRLRYAFLAGDVLDADTVDRLHRLAPAARVVNFYGATETPQAMGWHALPRELPARSRIPLGRGIDDVQLLVLGSGNGLAGIGELGEIAIRTPHLARGYLDDEALTRERFVASPFSGDPADRVYRTGDLGRYRPDGLVEFAGRRDGQVKVRGFRVELPAVESALRAHPAVREAAVLCHGGAPATPGERRLVAYVTGEEGLVPTGPELRGFLAMRLPDYMVPSSFVVLDAFPLTPNGKVDRRALERIEPSAERPAHVPPRSATEKAVAAAWADVLGSAAPSVDESFFDVGGHSLAAARLIARLQSAFGVTLGVRSLFERPTIAGLAALLDALTLSDGPPVAAGDTAEREELEF